MLKRRRLSGQQLCAAFCDHHNILTSHTELTGYVNPRFIAEHHSRLKLRLVAAHQIGPFVTVHPETVTNPVREVFVIRSVPGIGDHLARCCVYILTGDARPRSLERCSLGSLYDVKDLELFVRWFPKDRRASYVRRVVL